MLFRKNEKIFLILLAIALPFSPFQYLFSASNEEEKLISTPEHSLQMFDIELSMNSVDIDNFIHHQVGSPFEFKLVKPEDIIDLSVYKRFANQKCKQSYREQMLKEFENKWTNLYGRKVAGKMLQQFLLLVDSFDHDGAVVFSALINRKNFEQMVKEYSTLLKYSGRESWIHSYLDLANHPEFLTNEAINKAFLHPLLVAMISYRMGAPIRIVDARGKDTEQFSVLACDNVPHIDSSPFSDEYKIILTWEKDKTSGPKGQNLVFIPGTHQGVRNCFLDDENGPWSTESANLFLSRERIEQVFKFQQEVWGSKMPMVIEVTHKEFPLTTVFEAGSLVHHRYRTETGNARSCIFLAFHRASDSPGQLISQKTPKEDINIKDLNSFLLEEKELVANAEFLSAISNESSQIKNLLERLGSSMDDTSIIKLEALALSKDALDQWKTNVTDAPTVEEIKIGRQFIPLGKSLTYEDMLEMVDNMMIFDKHGPLDLVFYSNTSEYLCRKWARNHIREMKIDTLKTHLRNEWAQTLESPHQDQLIIKEELQSIAYQLANIADMKRKSGLDSIVPKGERITSNDAYRSVEQLLRDLGEMVVRCPDRHAFLSTSLFLFWACDTLMRFEKTHDIIIKEIGIKLLRNYIATSILIEKQVQGKADKAPII